MYRTAAIVLGFATLSQPAAAEDPRFEALVQALLHRGDRVISAGEFHYILRVREQTPTDAEVQAQVAQIRATLRDQLRQHANNAEMASRIQTAIDTAGDYVPAQVHANADLQFQYYFAMEGPQLGGDRYMEVSVFDRVASKYGDPRQVLIRSLGPTGGTSIDQNPQAGGMVILANGARDVYQPSQEPQRLGRANGSLATQLADLDVTRIGDWLSTAVTDVAVTPLQTEPGVDAVEYKLTVNAKSAPDAAETSSVRVIIHVVPGRGFITPLIREEDAAGQLLFEWISQDYFQVAGSNLWYPGNCEFRSRQPMKSEPHFERYEFRRDGVQLNHQLSEQQFTVAVPPGTTLLDATSGANVNYTSTRPVSLSIDDVARIAQLPGVAPAASPVSDRRVPLSGSPQWRTSVLIGNFVLIVVVAWILRRKWARGSAHRSE